MRRKDNKSTGNAGSRSRKQERAEAAWLKDLPRFAVRLFGASRLRHLPADEGMRNWYD